jgi:hypothetical protein
VSKTLKIVGLCGSLAGNSKSRVITISEQQG